MENQVRKPRGWYYLLSVLIFVLGCGISFAFLFLNPGDIPSLLDDIDDTLDRLSRVVVPGSADLELATSGTFNIYYEYRSLVDGRSYDSSQNPPSLDCSIKTQDGEIDIPVETFNISINTYSVGIEEERYEGVLIKRFSIDEPGLYHIDCQYLNGAKQPEIVLAIGENIVGNFLGVIGKVGWKILISLSIVCSSALMAITIAIVIAVKRSRSINEPDTATNNG